MDRTILRHSPASCSPRRRVVLPRTPVDSLDLRFERVDARKVLRCQFPGGRFTGSHGVELWRDAGETQPCHSHGRTVGDGLRPTPDFLSSGEGGSRHPPDAPHMRPRYRVASNLRRWGSARRRGTTYDSGHACEDNV